MADFVEATIPSHLRPWVRSMVGYRIVGLPPGVHIGMPSDTITLVFSLGTPLDLVGADGRRDRFDTVAAGLHAGPAHIHHDGHQHGVQLGLTPAGASLILGGPPGEVAGTSVDLAELIGPAARRLHERLSMTPGWDDRFALVTDALFAGAEPRWDPAPEVMHAWWLLRRSRGRVPIHEVASEVGWSSRHLGECFRAEFGQPPKITARVLRFQESHRLVSAGRPLAEVAAVCGFADQSHLDREWRAFVGSPPTRWMQEDDLTFVQDAPTPGARG